MFVMRNNEKFMVCPYNNSHVMLPLRYESHVRKCSMQHTSTYETCPFNAKHHVEKGEIRAHMSQCPDKYRVEKEVLYQVTNSRVNKENEELSRTESRPTLFTNGENWDEEIDISVKTSIRVKPDKREYLNKTKSQRKKDREEAVEEYKKKLEEEQHKKDGRVDSLARQLFDTKLSTINESDNYSDITVTNRTLANQTFEYDCDDVLSTRGSTISSNYSLPSRGRGIAFSNTSSLRSANTGLRSRTFATNETECDSNSFCETQYEVSSVETNRSSYASCIRQSRIKDSKLFK